MITIPADLFEDLVKTAKELYKRVEYLAPEKFDNRAHEEEFEEMLSNAEEVIGEAEQHL